MRPELRAHDLDLSARTLEYSIPIFSASFAKIRLEERGENAVTDGQPDAWTKRPFLYLPSGR